MKNQQHPEAVVAVLAANSIGFVKEVLALYQSQTPFVILRNQDQRSTFDQIHIERIIEPSPGTGWIHHTKTIFSDADSLAQFTFSSGTEGRPKAIALSHRALADVVARVNDAMGLDGSVKEYIGIPTSYSFGLARVRACAAVGGSCYIPANGFDPIETAEMLRDDEINALSAVPTLLRTLLGFPELFADHGSKLRWIEIGSQYMSRDEKEQLRALFPNARIIQHYGLTEASRSTFLDITHTQGEALESVGKTTGETEARIGNDGRIQVRGPHTAMGVLTPNGIEPITDDEGWLQTNDLGELRDGYLYYHGRADDLINCGGMKLSPEAIEHKLYEQLQISEGIAIARVPDKNRGDGVLLSYVQTNGLDQDRLKKATSEILDSMGLSVGKALHLMSVDALPTTGSGKVQRSKLTELFETQRAQKKTTQSTAPTDTDSSHSNDDLESKLVSAWGSVLEDDEVSLHTSFYEHGGDSLSSIALMLSLERMHIDRATIARIFDGETIAQIVASQGAEHTAARIPRTNERIASDTINSVRGILVLLLIWIHFSPGLWERLPVSSDRINTLLNPVNRMGTPGFAIVFGLGVGYFFMHQMDQKSSGVFKRIRLATIMILTGIVALGAFKFAHIKITKTELAVPMMSVLLYSVLLYYLLAVWSIPLWHRLLRSTKLRVISSLIFAALCFAIHLALARWVNQRTYENGFAELVSLMLFAKYNYFLMTGTVMLGVAAGALFRQSVHTIKEHAWKYMSVGTVLMALSVLVTFLMGRAQDWLTLGTPTVTMIIGYYGVIVGLLGLMIVMLNKSSRDGLISIGIAILAACGILSLPMFIGHELVLPSIDILKSLGAPSSMALLGCLGIFFVVAAYFIRRVMRIY